AWHQMPYIICRLGWHLMSSQEFFQPAQTSHFQAHAVPFQWLRLCQACRAQEMDTARSNGWIQQAHDV
ncbi:MAG TPA: hypothetical protein VFR76_03835, partial [Verrucomicrobiae bacterium]|nr:hypothetical protein [Verrucomicrobiae bacterium]